MRLLRIQRSILFELSFVFALALVVVTAVLFTGQSLMMMSRWQELNFSYVWKLLPALLPVAVAYGMPYAFLLSVALTFNRMVSDRELVVVRISGVHPRVAVAPVLALGAVLSVLSLGCNGWLLPQAAQALRQQERNLTDIFFASLEGSEDGLALGQCRLSYRAYVPVGDANRRGMFREFELDQRDKEGSLVRKIFGERGYLSRDGDELVLESDIAWVFAEDSESGSRKPAVGPRSVNVGRIEDLEASTPLRELLGMLQFERKAKDVALPDLVYMVERGDMPIVPRIRSLTELHTRLSNAATPFVFGLVAAAVGLQLSTRGRRLMGFLLAFLPVLLIHFPLALAGRALADGGRWPVWAAIWMADAVLLAGGGFLLWRAYHR